MKRLPAASHDMAALIDVTRDAVEKSMGHSELDV